MKKLLFLLLAGIAAVNVNAQSDITVAEPEFSGQVVYVKSDTEGVLLQKENAQVKTKAGASMFIVGIGSVKSRIHIDGKQSRTRIPQAYNIKFIVRAVDNKTDPLDIINVVQFDINGNARRAELSKASTFGGSSSNNMKRIDFNYKKYGNDSYLISFDNLKKGEYGISVSNPNDKDERNSLIMATFGID